MFGANARIVQPGGDGMNIAGLAVFVLHDVAEAAVQNAGRTVGERRGVTARFAAAATGLDAQQLHTFVIDE